MIIKGGSCMYNYASILNDLFDDVVESLKNSDYSIMVSDKDINSLADSDVPYNQYIDEDKNLYFDFALAGIEKDLIEVEKTSNIISITIKGKENAEKYAYTNKGIKFPKNKNVTIATITVTEKYDAEPEISFENGLLRFKFLIKAEEKARVLSIK